MLVRQAMNQSGVTGIALTKIDVLDTFEEIQVCIAYKLDGKTIDYFPSSEDDQANVEPVYEIFDGWKSKTTGINNFDDLPDLAKKYINRISVLTNTKIDLVSTSPRREDTILINELFS